MKARDAQRPDALSLGAVFMYHGPRRGLLRRRGVGVGRVIGIDASEGVIHVRTMRQDADGSVIVDIGHIPITLTAFRESLHEVHDERAKHAAADTGHTLELWRRRHALDEVGAFFCPLWKAQEMAWEAALEAEPLHRRGELNVSYAFPTRDPHGHFTVVEVEVARRAPATDPVA
jgi:hypothetical protein